MSTREEYAAKYTCGSCTNYRFEGNDERGKCNHFNEYYWPSDSCKNHWEEASDWYKEKRPVCK